MSTVQADVDFGGTARAHQTVHVYNHGTTTHADIFEHDGTTPMANPSTVLGNGHVVFSVAPGTYDVVGDDLTRTVVLAPAAPAVSVAKPTVLVTLSGMGTVLGPLEVDPTADASAWDERSTVLNTYGVMFAVPTPNSTVFMTVRNPAGVPLSLGAQYELDLLKIADADGTLLTGPGLSCYRSQYNTVALTDAGAMPFDPSQDYGIDGTNYVGAETYNGGGPPSGVTIVQPGWYAANVYLSIGAPPA